MKWLILCLGILANASASVLVKMAMIPPRKFPSLNDPVGAFANWPFWAGVCLYGLAFLLYAAALARLPLNVAHPILTAGAVASVAIFSYFLFREAFYWTTVAGLLFIAVGVVLLTARNV